MKKEILCCGTVLAVVLSLTACDTVGNLFRDKRADAEAAYDEGMRQLALKQYDVAAQKFIVSSYLAPDEPAPRLALCQTYSAKGDLDAAKTACEQALAKDPNEPQLYYLLGSIDLLLKRPAEAKQRFEKALNLRPDYRAALAAKGAANLQLENYEGAVESLTRAHALDKANISVLNNLAVALMHLKRCNESEQMLLEAGALGANISSLQAAQTKLCAGQSKDFPKNIEDSVAVAAPAAGVSASSAEGMKRFVTAAGKSFFIDEHPASGIGYSKCVDAGICKKPPYDKYNRMPDYKGEPAMSVNYLGADTYCKWKEKRLPTRAEYDAAYKSISWPGCCARGVIPGEWVNDGGGEPNDKIIQVRPAGERLTEKRRKRKIGVDSSTVRCAMNAE